MHCISFLQFIKCFILGFHFESSTVIFYITWPEVPHLPNLASVARRRPFSSQIRFGLYIIYESWVSGFFFVCFRAIMLFLVE